jgi:hypothetical protein
MRDKQEIILSLTIVFDQGGYLHQKSEDKDAKGSKGKIMACEVP